MSKFNIDSWISGEEPEKKEPNSEKRSGGFDIDSWIGDNAKSDTTPPPDSSSRSVEKYESEKADEGKVQLRDMNAGNARLKMSEVGNNVENVEMPKHVARAEEIDVDGMKVRADGIEYDGVKTPIGGYVNVETPHGVRTMRLKEISEGKPILEYDEDAVEKNYKKYGLRNDGKTYKGTGWLGELKTANGDVATEYTSQSNAVRDKNGKRINFPTLVPTLTKEEIKEMTEDVIPNQKPVPDAIMQKAVDHALKMQKEGKSVFANDGVYLGGYGAGVTLPGDKFEKMLKDGKVKYDMTAAEQIRLNAEAETGDKKYGKGALGQIAAILKRTIDPVLFNAMSIEERNTLNDLAELRLGRVGQQHNRVDDSLTAEDRKKAGRAAEAAMPNDDATWADKAVRVGIDEKVARRAEGEGVNDYRLRIAGEADKLFKERLQRIAEANNKISQTEKTALDKILVGGAESLGYQYGFGVGVKAGSVLRSLMPYAKGVETAAEIGLPAAMSFGNRYTELTSDEYKLDKAGNPVKVAEGDSPAVGAAKAAIGAVAEAAIEKFGGDVIDKGVGAALKGVGSALKKKKWSGPLLEFGRNFGNFTKATQLNSPVGEVFEEDLQYVFDDMLGLNKKGSEKNDTIAEAFSNDKDKYGRLSARGHLDTFLSLIGLIGAQAAVSAGAAAIDAPRMIHNAEELNGLLASAGVSKDNIQRMSPEEREQLRQIWNECSQNPEKARELLNKTNGFLKDSADAIADQMNVKLAEDIASSGAQPVAFTIPTEANGTTPLFTQQAIEDNITGEVRTANVATDDKTKVAIRDNGDGTFTVINMLRGGMDTDCSDLASAQKLAQSFALSNQRSVIERNSKLRLIAAVKQGKFNGLDVVVMNNADELKARLGNLAQGQNLFGLTLMDMMSVPSNTESMTTPNGVVLMFADALQTPNAVTDNLNERVKDFKPEAIEGRNGSLAYGDDIMGRFSIQEPQTQETEETTSTTTDTTNEEGSGDEGGNSQTPQDKVDVFKGFVDAATQLVKDYNYSGNEDDALREKIWQNKKQFREWLKSLSSEELDDLLIQLPEDRDGVFGEYYMDVERAIKYSKNNGSKNKAYEQFKAKPIKDENGKLISPFAGEARNEYIQARLKEMGADGKSATDEQMKQIEAEIAEIEKPFLDEVKNQKKSSNKNNPLVRGSIRRFIDTHNVGEDGFLGALEFMGIYSIPVDYNLTQRGGKVVFKKGDPAVDHIKKLLDGYGELRMSKSGKIYLKGRRFLPSHLRVLFGDSFKVGGNDNAIERFYAEVFGKKPEDTIGADYGEIDAQIQKEYAMYQAWSAKQKHSNKLEGMTTPKAMKRLDELHGIENPTQKEKGEIRALEAWISDRIDEVQKLIDEYHTEEDVLADEDNYEKLNRELRMLNGDIPYAEPAVNWGNGEEYYIEDLENRLTDDMAAQREYDEALVEVNRFNADSNEVQAFNESNLANLKRGDTIRFDHAGNEMDFYSFEDGVLTVAPLGTVSAGFDIDEKNLVKYQVTEDGFKKIGDNKNGRNNTKDTNDVQPGDEEGERSGTEEGNGETGGNPLQGGEGSSGGRKEKELTPERKQLRERVRKAYMTLVNPKASKEDIDAALELINSGVPASVIDAKDFTLDDIASWPVKGIKVESEADVAHLCQMLSNPYFEVAKTLYLDRDGKIIGVHISSTGKLSGAQLKYDEIADNAPKGTYGIVLSHNHPSGNINPSPQDVLVTEDAKKYFESKGLNFIDHIITDTDRFWSIAKNGTGYIRNGSDIVIDRSDKNNDILGGKETISEPTDKYNVVGYDDRYSLEKGSGNFVNSTIEMLASKLSTHNTEGSYIIGLNRHARISTIALVPENADEEKLKEFVKDNLLACESFIIMAGSKRFDRVGLTSALRDVVGHDGSDAQIIAVYSLFGKKMIVEDINGMVNYEFAYKLKDEDVFIKPKKQATDNRKQTKKKLPTIEEIAAEFRRISNNGVPNDNDYDNSIEVAKDIVKDIEDGNYNGFHHWYKTESGMSGDDKPNGFFELFKFVTGIDLSGKNEHEVYRNIIEYIDGKKGSLLGNLGISASDLYKKILDGYTVEVEDKYGTKDVILLKDGKVFDKDCYGIYHELSESELNGFAAKKVKVSKPKKDATNVITDESPAIKARREYFDKLADIKGLSFFRSGNTMWLFGDYNVTFPMRSELAKNGFKYQGKPYMGFQLQDINSIPQSSKIWDMIDESPNGIDDFIKKRDANGKKKKEVSKIQSEEDKEKKRKEEQGKILDRPEFNVSKEQQKKEAEDLDIDDLFETKGVFTGSAADYEKPSLIHVGTGEGSQVYGWGLYGSTVRGVAEGYASNALQNAIIDGKLVRNPSTKYGIGFVVAQNMLHNNKWNVEYVKKYAKENIGKYKNALAVYDFLSNHTIEKSGKYIYSQTFFTNRPEGDESHLLSWYEPVSEENISRINEQGIIERGEDFIFEIDEQMSSGGTSRDIYNGLVRIFGSPKASSEFLARADIDGIKYPVDSYGGKDVKDGDKAGWNYVSFRDDNIRVDHKWRDGEQLFEEKTPIQEDTRSRIEKVYADWVEEDMPDWVNSLNENEARGYAHLLEVASKANGDITAMKRLEAFENKHKTAYEAPAKAEEQKRVDEAEAARKAEEEAKRKESEKKRQEIADRIARLSNPKFRDGTKMAMLALNIGNALRRGDIPKKAMAMGKAMVGGENGTLVQQWKDNSVLGVVDNASKRQLDNWVEMAVRDKKYELPHEGDVDKWVNPIRNTAGDQVADDLKTMFMRAINDVRSRRGETEHQDFFWGVGGQGEFWHMYGEEKPRNKRGKKINDGTMQMTLFEEKTPITPEEDAAYMDAVKRGDMETAARMVDDVERMEAIRFCGNLKIPQQNGKHSTAKHILSKLEKKTEKNRYPLSYDSSKSVVSLGEGMSYNDAICTLAMLAMSKMPVGGYNFEGVGEYLRDKYSLFAYTDNISQAAIALQDRFSRKYYASTTLGLNAFSVKQSDPITYDDKGNVIPLSQRFNPDNSSSLYEEKAPIAETKMDKVMNFGIRTASSFFKESEDKSFDAFVKYADDSLGEKANVLHRLYGSWYVNAALSLPDDMRDAIDLQASSKARALAGLTPRGKDAPGHRVANVIQEHLIPSASEHVNEASYNGGLDADQRLGVNLALDSVNKPNGHFMLADGTGFGKTRQILAIADQFKSTNPNARILIITKSDEVLSDAFAKDAKAMGIDTSRFTMGTYPGLGLGKFNNGEWDLVLLDEAHLVSNPASLRSQNLWRMRIKHKVFATATPMDRPTDATYFMAELNNISQETLAERLGYRIEVRAPEGSDPYQVAVPMAGQDFNSVKRNVIVERDKAIAGGKMIRRAYPFLGDIDMEYTIPMSNDNRNNDGEVAAYAATQINKLKYLPQIKFYNSITRRELVYKRSDYEDNPDGWREIVERKKHELNTDKTNAWDNLNESAKAEEAAKVAENILNNNPDARVIIVGQQVGVRTIDGGSLSKPEELMKLKGIERVIQFGRVKYKVEPSLEIAKRILDELGLGGDVQMLSSKTPKKSRQGIVDNFVGHNKRILIMTQAVGGTGINLDDTDGTHPTYMLVLNKGYSAKELDQLLGRISRKNTKSFANALFLSNNSMADTHNVRTMGAKMNILKAIQGGADMDALGDMSNDRSSDGEGVLHEEKFPLQSESENDTILGNEQNSDNDKADISSSMNSIKMPEEIISAINAIPDADFEKIYHGSKQDFLTSGISVKFATLASDVDALFDRTENTIFIDNKLRTNIDELTKAFRHELVHVRQVREGNNEPKGFDPFNAISAFKYIMDPGETEADYFANGLFDEYDELMKLIREDWSDDFADVEIGEVKIEDWKKNIVSPIGIRKLQQSAKNNRDLGEVLNKIEAKDSNLPAKLEEVGERLMEGENRLLVSTELGWPITNPSAYKKVTVPNGKARMEIRGRTDETTGKRKSINPVAIAEKLKEMGIEAHAVGPSEIDIFATPETVSNIKKINILRNRSIEYNEDILHEEKAAITPEEDAAYADAVERGDMETARKMVREAAAKAMPNTKVVDKDGLPKVVYHGTQNEFTVFDPYWDANSDSHNPNRARGLVYFATTKEGAFRAGKGTKIMSCFINAKKVRGYGGPGIYWGDVENPKYIAKCKKEGFDAIRVRDEGHGTIAVFSPSQIKSADPVTYDDAGNVIPLSERFDLSNDSILYEEKANIGEEEQELRFFYNAAVDDWRTKHNMSELASIAKVSVAELNRRVNRLMNNPREVETIISVIESWPTGQTATAEEQALMGKMLVKAEGVYNDMFNQRKAAEEAGNKELADTLAVQMEMYWPTVDRIQRANQKIGNAAGRALQARQLGVANDYSLAAVERRVRNAIGDSRLSPEQRKYLERMVKDADRAGILADEEKRNAFLIRMDETIRDIMAGAKNEVSAKVLTAKGKKQIEIEYDAALNNIWHHGTTHGGTIVGLPRGKKWLDAIQRYHLALGEGYTDGKPDEQKMIELIIADCESKGVIATPWEIRQILSQMGFSITPPKTQLELDRRELNTQHLIQQQIDFINKFGELPPTTGYNRDAATLAVRALQKERRRLIKEKGLDAKNEDGRLKSALGSLKTRLRNRIEELENAVKTNTPIAKGEKRELSDDEVVMLRAQLKKAKEAYDAIFPKNQEEVLESKVIRTIKMLGKIRDEWQAILDNAKATGDFDKTDAEPSAVSKDPRVIAAKEEIKRIKGEWQQLKDALYPNGTAKEIDKRIEKRIETYENEIDRLDKILFNAEIGSSFEDKRKELAKAKKERNSDEAVNNDPRVIQRKADLKRKRAEIDAFIAKLAKEDEPGIVKVGEKLDTIFNVLPRAIKTMLDQSQILSQGLFATGRLAVSDPKAVGRAIADSFKVFASQEAADSVNEMLANDIYFQDFKKLGGRVYGAADSGGKAEEFRGTERKIGKLSVDMIPGVKASERSFTTYLNLMNAALYRVMIEGGSWGEGGPTQNERESLVDGISTITGSSTKGERASAAASWLFFAPRYAMATLKLAMLHPLWSPFMVHGKDKGVSDYSLRQRANVSKEMAKTILPTMLAVAAFQAIMNALFNPDDEDEKWQDFLDLRSSDFLAARVGNGRYNMLKPITIWWTLLARLVNGNSAHYGVEKPVNFSNTVGQLIRGKFSPMAGLLTDIVTGKTYVGEELDWGKFSMRKRGEKRVSGVGHLIESLGIPLYFGDVVDNYRTNNPIAATVLSLLSFFGTRVSSYEDEYERTVGAARTKMSKVNTAFNNAQKNMDKISDVPDAESRKDGIENIRSTLNEVREFYQNNKGSISIAQQMDEAKLFDDLKSFEKEENKARKLGMDKLADKYTDLRIKTQDQLIRMYRKLQNSRKDK